MNRMWRHAHSVLSVFVTVLFQKQPMFIFSRDTFTEILATVKANRLRTFLTAFSVAWGIFILIILLGSGEGLRNGAEEQFKSDAVNSIWIFGGVTTKPFAGFQKGR